MPLSKLTDMSILQQIAKNLTEVYFGGNWTAANLKDQLADVTWQEATMKLDNINSIVTLSFHIHYYVHAVLQFLEGKLFVSKDKLSFDHPSINNAREWSNMMEGMWKEMERFVSKVGALDDALLLDDFIKSDYGNYFRNLHGIIEHTHYHLGQIVIIKKMIRS